MLSHFDLLAPVYDRLVAPFLGRPDLDRWRELLRLPTGGRLLDAGGGTGRVSALLRPLVGHVVVADVSFGMLRRAREKSGIDPLQADAACLPFPDAAFERIIVTDALHHFPRQRQSLRELARVLAPGGVLVIEEFDISRWSAKSMALLEKLTLMGSRFPKAEEIREMLRSCGLEAEVRRGKGFAVMIVARKRSQPTP